MAGRRVFGVLRANNGAFRFVFRVWPPVSPQIQRRGGGGKGVDLRVEWAEPGMSPGCAGPPGCLVSVPCLLSLLFSQETLSCCLQLQNPGSLGMLRAGADAASPPGNLDGGGRPPHPTGRRKEGAHPAGRANQRKAPRPTHDHSAAPRGRRPCGQGVFPVTASTFHVEERGVGATYLDGPGPWWFRTLPSGCGVVAAGRGEVAGSLASTSLPRHGRIM